ncbi:hypothetical protein [Agromyces laixinhei]|uniref:hypothetical protein n=1 Tax=Agromyces laixinhei TaxID=2585717 RepID=UPI0011165B1C|nr:hypothetical protein [Agromyces laixinhei]
MDDIARSKQAVSQPDVRQFVAAASNQRDEEWLAGTTTTSKAAAHALMLRHGISGVGMLDRTGVLVREPDNPVYAGAIAVHVEGDRIGYLSSGTAGGFPLGDGAVTVPVRLFSADTPSGFRVEGWAWIGSRKPRWTFNEVDRPPMTSAEKRLANHQRARRMVADAIARDDERGDQFRASLVDGVHYLELVEPIKQLKRDGRLEEALVLAYKAIEAAEDGSRFEGKRALPPFYTEQAAIILRKLGRHDEEIEVLRRWMRNSDPKYWQSAIVDRLAKLTGSRPWTELS